MIRLHNWLTHETVSGTFVILAALIALIWANSPWSASYVALNNYEFGYAPWGLSLRLERWASEGLLTMFFFVVGLELKHEFVHGSMRHPRQAAVPILAAVGGTIGPAALYLLVVWQFGNSDALIGWAVPAATDIAFALAVLAVFGRGLPVALRLFLLTLAVVDDLLAILVIALLFTESFNLLAFGAAVLGAGAFAVVSRMEKGAWWFLVPIASFTWFMTHESGIHSTIAGVLMGLSVAASPIHGEAISRAKSYEYFWRPISAGFALPVFAFFAAGVSLGGGDGAIKLLTEPVALGIILAMVIGKSFGVLMTTAGSIKLTSMHLPKSIGMRDLLPLGMLSGIGFTVSLLIAELAFAGTRYYDVSTIGVIVGSTISASLGAAALAWDKRKAAILDIDNGGLPDSPLESEPWQ